MGDAELQTPPLDAQALRRLEQRAREQAEAAVDTPARVLAQLADAEEQHAHAFTALPIAIPTDVNDDALRDAPELARVCLAFEQFMSAVAAAHARVGPTLRAAVDARVSALRTTYERKVALLVAELDEAAEKEHAFDVACRGLQAAADGNDAQVTALRTRRMSSKRSTERRAILETIEAIKDADSDRVSALGDVTAGAVDVYATLLAASRTHVAELRTAISSGNGGCGGPDALGDAADTFPVFVAMTSWLNDVFVRVVPVEEAFVRRLQKLARSHRGTKLVVSSAAVDDDDGSVSKHQVGELEVEALLNGLAEYHRLRTVNLLDPISRTLQFSRRKLSHTHQELRECLADTQRRVDRTRAKLESRSSRLPAEDAEELIRDAMVASGGLTHEELALALGNDSPSENGSSTNELSESTGPLAEPETGDEADEDREQKAARALSETSVDNNTSKSAVVNGKDVDKVVATLEQLRDLDRKHQEERDDMRRSLATASRFAVDTMELMIRDHCKHLDMALNVLDDTVRLASKVEFADVGAGAASTIATNAKDSESFATLLAQLESRYLDREERDRREAGDQVDWCSGDDVNALASTAQRSFPHIDWFRRVLGSALENVVDWSRNEIKSGGWRTVWPCWFVLAVFLMVRICFHVTALEGIMAQTSRLQQINSHELTRLSAILRGST